METKTTNVSTINPKIIGLNPIFLISLKLVFRPMADKAIIMQNFEDLEKAFTRAPGMIPALRIATITRKKMMKYGKIFFKLTDIHPLPLSDLASSLSVIIEKIKTYGIMNNVLVSFTMTAVLPANSEKAYPAATTEDVSLTAVPTHKPYPTLDMPSAIPIHGIITTVRISKMNVDEIAYATSSSFALITGPTAATAEPPHIAVLTDSKFVSFQLVPNNLPIRFPCAERSSHGKDHHK